MIRKMGNRTIKLMFAFICLIMFLLTIHGAIAFNSTNIAHVYTFEELAGGTILADQVASMNGTKEGNTSINASVINGNAIYFNGDESNINFSTVSMLPHGAKQWSISFWIKALNPTGSEQCIIDQWSGVNVDRQWALNVFDAPTANITFLGYDTGVRTLATLGDGLRDSNWHHFAIRFNGTGIESFMDNKTETDYNMAFAGIQAYSGVRPVLIGVKRVAGYPFKGLIDEFYVWNRSITRNEIGILSANTSDSYYNGFNPPTFVYPSPANNSHNNTQVTFNLSCASGLKYFIYFDNTSTPTTLVVNNASIGNYTTSVSNEEQYYIRARCYDETTGVYSSYNTIRTWFYDTISPSIILNSGNFFNSNNLSNVNQYNNLIPLNITFTDNIDLFAFMINITKNSICYFNVSNESIGGTSFTYNNTLDTSAWPSGTYNIEIMASDSHTDEKINPYMYSTTEKGLIFNTDEGNEIRIESVNNVVATAIKKIDRYELNFDFKDGKIADRIFDIKSDNPITYKPNTKYKGHFVVWNNGKGNWIDFEGVSQEPTITKISDYHYKVTFKDMGSNVAFKSIGGLNVRNINYTWYRGNQTHNTPSAYVSNPTQLYLNLSFDNATMSYINATLTYNNTLYNNTEIYYNDDYYLFIINLTASSDVGVIDFYWNVSIIQIDTSSINFSILHNHTLYDWNLKHCLDGNKTIQFKIFHEDYTNLALTSDVFDVDANYWINAGYVKNISFRNISVNNVTLCFDYIDTNIYADIYLKYSISGGFTHRYYLFNHTLTNVTQNMSIFNFNDTTDKSELRLTIRNIISYDYLPLILGKLLRYYPETQTWQVVQMDLSGDYGLNTFNIIDRVTDYKLLFYNTSNVLLKETEALKFSCSNDLCELTVLIDLDAAGSIERDIDVGYNYNNVTNNLTITWTDSLGLYTTVNAKVTKSYSDGDLTICNITQSGVSGTITCDLSGYEGLVYLQLQTSNSPYTSKFSEWIDLGKIKLHQIIGSSGGLIALFILITLIFAGVYVNAISVIIMTIAGLVLLMFLGMLSYLSMFFLISACVIGIIIALLVRN